MAAGKARTRGPISKALAGKMSIQRAFSELMNDYRNGVANAADAWVAGEVAYLKEYVPQIKEFVNTDEFRNKTPQERIVFTLQKTSEIAKKYKENHVSKLNQDILSAYKSPQQPTQSSSGSSVGGTASKNTGKTIVV